MGEFFDTIQAFYDSNTEISIAVVVAIVIALILKPRNAGKIVGAIAIIFIIGYVVVEVVNLTSSTMDKKGEAASRTDREFQESGQ